jgi:hypothetical protein
MEFNFGSGLSFKTVNENLIVLLHFELLSGDFNNCVHDICIDFLDFGSAKLEKFSKTQGNGRKYFLIASSLAPLLLKEKGMGVEVFELICEKNSSPQRR